MHEQSVLDDIARIKQLDKSDMLSFCVDASKHYGKAGTLVRDLSIDYPEPQTVIVAGMGGSAIGGELLKDWARDRITVPIEICREYLLPAYASKKTMVIVTSYSGETEESLSVLLDAAKRKCMTICISSGGTMQEISRKLDVPHVRVPSGMAPRAMLPYLFMPLPMIMEKVGLVFDVDPEISEAIEVLKQISDENSPAKPMSKNPSKTLAANVEGTVPVVYGFGFYRAVAQRFKTQFNENSKVPSKWEYFPELDHNEIVGWEGIKDLAKLFSVTLIRDREEPEEMRQRIEATAQLIRKESLRIHEVWSRGKGKIARMCSAICIGDFASVYLAILKGIDPTLVRTIASLKETIKQSGMKDRVIRELEKLAA